MRLLKILLNFFIAKRLENFAGKGIVNSDGGSGINEYVKKQFDASITWKDVKWLVGYVYRIYFSLIEIANLHTIFTVKYENYNPEYLTFIMFNRKIKSI